MTDETTDDTAALVNPVRRGPGRPPNQKPETVPIQSIDKPVVEAGVRPANRKPFGTMDQKMAYPERQNFHRHWFNDVPGRIGRAIEAGYTYVKAKDDKNVSMFVGTAEGGGPLTAFLMEIPEEWYQEDMAIQQREIDERESKIKRGELDSKEGDGRYIPKQGITIKHG